MLIYNRISKAGSSFLSDILTDIAKKKSFTLHHAPKEKYFLDTTEFVHFIAAMPDRSIYVNHCSFVSDEVFSEVQVSRRREGG